MDKNVVYIYMYTHTHTHTHTHTQEYYSTTKKDEQPAVHENLIDLESIMLRETSLRKTNTA